MELSKYELAIIKSALVNYGCEMQDLEKGGRTRVYIRNITTLPINDFILDISHLLTKIEEESKEE